jgi:hypothetical protein
MIRHISIDVHDPLRVARVLAEIWNGKAYKFLHPGSYTVMPCDRYGTAVVILPLANGWIPGVDVEPAQIGCTAPSDLVATYVAIHAAISVPTSQQQIEQIGQREGWRVLTREQGDAFRLVEFWLENRVLFELLPPGFETQYEQIMQPETIEAILGQLI